MPDIILEACLERLFEIGKQRIASFGEREFWGEEARN